MRLIALPIVLAFLVSPSAARAQAQSDPPRPAASGAAPALRIIPPAVGADQGPLARPPANPRAHVHCCSRKGALIGAAVGAAVGILAVRELCESGDCTKGYVLSAIYLGGLGAGIGALVGHPNLQRPLELPAHRRIGVLPVISRQSQAGAVSVRF